MGAEPGARFWARSAGGDASDIEKRVAEVARTRRVVFFTGEDSFWGRWPCVEFRAKGSGVGGSSGDRQGLGAGTESRRRAAVFSA